MKDYIDSQKTFSKLNHHYLQDHQINCKGLPNIFYILQYNITFFYLVKAETRYILCKRLNISITIFHYFDFRGADQTTKAIWKSREAERNGYLSSIGKFWYGNATLLSFSIMIWENDDMARILWNILRSYRTSMKVCNGAALGQVEYIGETVQSQDKSSSIKW